MKLNPTKCTFGASSGEFLRFMVSQRGIEANPEKIKAIIEMQPPKNANELQSLTGRLVASIGSYLVPLIDATILQDSWKSILQYLTSLSVLSQSNLGESLYLYLAVSPTTLSSTLVVEH